MKILVVEDSTSMRAYLATIIEGGTESYDLEIVEAASGFEALKTLPHHHFDAILTDINMPDIHGLDGRGPQARRRPRRRGVPGQAVPGGGADRQAATAAEGCVASL